MERWLFLQDESRKRIKTFAYDLTESLGNNWDFTRFVDYSPRRQPTEKGYSLDDCFKEKGKMENTVKLVIGQKILINKPTIRFAFRKRDIWADFTCEYNDERYIKTDGVFQKIFSSKIEDYSHQQIIA
jgi:hypothetical protein